MKWKRFFLVGVLTLFLFPQIIYAQFIANLDAISIGLTANKADRKAESEIGKYILPDNRAEPNIVVGIMDRTVFSLPAFFEVYLVVASDPSSPMPLPEPKRLKVGDVLPRNPNSYDLVINGPGKVVIQAALLGDPKYKPASEGQFGFKKLSGKH